MNLFFQIQDLWLLIFCMDDQEFVVNLNYVFLCFIIKVNQFLDRFVILLHLFFSFSHIKSWLVPYAYVFTESIACVLLSLFEIKAILLISSVKSCLSLLRFCCVFNISFLLFIN